jgi:hypothetical protein
MHHSRLVLALGLVLGLLDGGWSPQALDSFSDANTTEVQIEQADNSQGDDDQQDLLGQTVVGRGDQIVLKDMMATIVHVIWDDEAHGNIDREVESGGGQDEGEGSQDTQCPLRSLVEFMSGVLLGLDGGLAGGPDGDLSGLSTDGG